MINIPFSIEAKRQNAKSLGRAADLFGPTSTGAFVMRAWAQQTAGAGAVHRRYVESLRWHASETAPKLRVCSRPAQDPHDVAEQTTTC